jgi:hypothetical protein
VDDKKVTDHIDQLAREEHELFEREAKGKASEADREKLKRIQADLDQCWDLLRQRRAKREFGQDPEQAHLRDPKIIKGYLG